MAAGPVAITSERVPWYVWCSAAAYCPSDVQFRRASELRDSSVRIWDFGAPLGTFLEARGGIAMIASAPFDDWCHDAYDLDVEILRPPHMLLDAGILALHLRLRKSSCPRWTANS